MILIRSQETRHDQTLVQIIREQFVQIIPLLRGDIFVKTCLRMDSFEQKPPLGFLISCPVALR